ncbi:MAG: hypothetical protein JNJ58_08210 [Chitinophagaceae bacterium]|nr:hypothetical protein [Chitinophagaceae bacterium]
MSDMNQVQDTLNLQEHDPKKLPSMLNVLTILTYIGCAFGFLGGIYNYFTVCKSAEMIENMDMDASGKLGKMMASASELINKQCDNKLIIMIVTLLGAALCFYGAMQMRQMKKSGFMIYAVGELIVPIIFIVLLGSGAMGGMMLVGMIVPIVFIALYASQRKYLVN